MTRWHVKEKKAKARQKEVKDYKGLRGTRYVIAKENEIPQSA